MNFKLGEVGEYIPQNIEENEFLNDKLEQSDKDTYGTYYSVKFEGDAETFLMQAKKAPVVGQIEWGKIGRSKSGKSWRFTRVKREDTGTVSSGNSGDKYLKDVTDMPDRWMARLLPYFDQQRLVKDGKITEHGRLYIETALALAEESMRYVDAVRSGSLAVAHPSAAIKEESSPAAEPLRKQWDKAVTANDDYGDEPYDDV